MIKVKGIENSEVVWNYTSPPKFFRKIGKSPDVNGIFLVEVFKLKSFNNFTKEAVYIKTKDEKTKAAVQIEQKFNYASPKKKSYEMED